MDVRLQVASPTTFIFNKRLKQLYYRVGGEIRSDGVLESVDLKRDNKWIEWATPTSFSYTNGPVVDIDGNFIPPNLRKDVTKKGFRISNPPPSQINTPNDTTYLGISKTLNYFNLAYPDPHKRVVFNFVPPNFLPITTGQVYMPPYKKLNDFVNTMSRYDPDYKMLGMSPRYTRTDYAQLASVVSVLPNTSTAATPQLQIPATNAPVVAGTSAVLPAPSTSTAGTATALLSSENKNHPNLQKINDAVDRVRVFFKPNQKQGPQFDPATTFNVENLVNVRFPYNRYSIRSMWTPSLKEKPIQDRDVEKALQIMDSFLDSDERFFYERFDFDPTVDTVTFLNRSKPSADPHHAICLRPNMTNPDAEFKCDLEVIQFILTATRSVGVQQYYLTNDRIVMALCFASARLNCDVRLVLSRDMLSAQYPPLLFALFFCGAKIRIDCSNTIHHNKIIIVDDRAMANGSYNMSEGAENRNAENILFSIDEPFIREYVSAFEEFYDHSIPFDLDLNKWSRSSSCP